MNERSLMENTTKILWAVRVLGGVYLLFLLVLFLLWGRNQTYQDIPMADYVKLFSNYVPFKTTVEQFKMLNAGLINKSIVISNTIGHLLAFIPLGLIMAIGWKQKWQCHLAIVGFVALLIEMLQLFLRIGSFDVDAILLDVLGYFIGFCFVYTVNKYLIRKDVHDV